jgi:mono/diheme cytochrome c family protein
MFDRLILCTLLLASAAIADPSPSPQPSTGVGVRYDLGQPLTADQIAAIDISVLPNGDGLPKGKGTAREGAKVYATHCAACHGDQGEGRGDFPALVGGRGTLATNQPMLTVGSYWPTATTAFDYIRRAMPYNTPGVLTTDEVYAVTAWILEKNDILPVGTILDRRTLPTVRMPNRDGFVPDPRPDVTSLINRPPARQQPRVRLPP